MKLRPHYRNNLDVVHLDANAVRRSGIMPSDLSARWLSLGVTNGGRGRRVSPAAGPLACRQQAAEESQGPGVKPFTPDPSGPFGRDRRVTVTSITKRLSHRRGRTDRGARA